MADETPVTPTPEAVPAPAPEATAPAPEPQFNAQEAFARLERNLLTLATQMQGMQQSVPPAKGEEATADELWSLAQQGNRQAFELYQERIADRRFDKRFSQVQSVQSVQAQINALVSQYPEFADPNHPITQKAQVFKQALVRMGEPQQSINTDLNAMLRAVADSRAIIQPRSPVAPARSATPSHFAPSHAAAPSAAKPEAVSDVELRLAKQMGVKDPTKAKSRFYERQANGQSSVSPTVVAALDIQERQGNVR